MLAAHLEPGRIDRLERRLRFAALLPSLHLQIGRGNGQLQTVTDYLGNTRLAVGSNDSWHFTAGASWNLERLAFHPEELRLAREAERSSSHRERLLREVAELHGERQRLLAELRSAPPRSTVERDAVLMRIEALAAWLEELTDGRVRLSARSHGAAEPGSDLSSRPTAAGPPTAGPPAAPPPAARPATAGPYTPRRPTDGE